MAGRTKAKSNNKNNSKKKATINKKNNSSKNKKTTVSKQKNTTISKASSTKKNGTVSIKKENKKVDNKSGILVELDSLKKVFLKKKKELVSKFNNSPKYIKYLGLACVLCACILIIEGINGLFK